MNGLCFLIIKLLKLNPEKSKQKHNICEKLNYIWIVIKHISQSPKNETKNK